MGDRGINVERFLRDAGPLFRLEILHRPHVVQPVGELDQDDADVRDHRQHHLADILGLLFFLGKIADVGDLGQAVDEMRDLVAEIGADSVEIDQRVLDDVVQQAGRDADLIEPHIGQDLGNLERMNQIRFAGSTLLAAVMKRGEKIRPPDQIDIRVRPVAFIPFR